MWRRLNRSWLWLAGIFLPLAALGLSPAPTADLPVSPFRVMLHRVRVGMSAEEVIALLGPPTEQSHPGLSLGHHYYYWSMSDGTLEVSCDLAGAVYDYRRRAPRETRPDEFQRMAEGALRRWLRNPAPGPRDE